MHEENSEAGQQWHLSRTINLSHLATTVALVIGMVSYVGQIEKEVAIQGNMIEHIKNDMIKQSKNNSDMFTRIEKSMDKMDAKMDRLFDLLHKENKI
jgi:uncharacterized coiled-coil protein SlyX